MSERDATGILAIRPRLFAAIFAGVALLIVGMSWRAYQSVGVHLEARVFSELERHVSAAKRVLEAEARPSSPHELSRIAHELSAETELRISIIVADRGLVGDSAFKPGELSAIKEQVGYETMMRRPELRAAMDKGRARSRHFSELLEEEMLFAASALEFRAADGGITKAIVRVGLPAQVADAPPPELQQAVAVAALVLLVAAASIGGWLSSEASRHYQELIQQVASAAGQQDAPGWVPDAGNPNPARFGGLSRKLAEAVSTLTGERKLIGDVLNSLGEAVIAVDATSMNM